MSVWQWLLLAWIVSHSIGDISRGFKAAKENELDPFLFAILAVLMLPLPYVLAWAAGAFS